MNVQDYFKMYQINPEKLSLIMAQLSADEKKEFYKLVLKDSNEIIDENNLNFFEVKNAKD